MLSFELSAIDLVLAIAVIILLIFHIKKASTKPFTKEKLFPENENSSKQTMEDLKPEKEMERPTPKPQMDSTKCPYGFGYLKKLDKDASIPDKCLSCSRIMECYSANQ